MGQLNPPNFTTGSGWTWKSPTAAKAGTVTRVFNSSVNFNHGEVKSIFLPKAPVAATAGSASFDGGATLSLGSLAADTMYEFPVTNISSSTVEVFVFKK